MQLFEIVGAVEGKNILLLQGPMGSFFNTLDQIFTRHGARTFRIGLNAGDAYFADADHFTPYKDTPQQWECFIEEFYRTHAIDMLFVFGDCRFYQEKAIQKAQEAGVTVFVFEEGYIRPDFITLEQEGVNKHSSLPRERAFYEALESHGEMECNKKNIRSIGSTYGRMAWQAIVYYLIGNLFSYKYPHYVHHKAFSAFWEGFYGVRNFLRKYLYKITEAGALKKFETTLAKRYYFVAIQTHDDFQIKKHSPYDTIEEFLEEVLYSFCKHAPKESFLVFKHHPMDRGKKNYKPFLKKMARRLGCEERIHILYDLHLPTLLKHAIATVTVNSTVGISSLYHATPVICLGDSLYDIEGLTSKGISLDAFWQNYTEVDYELFEKFRCYLIKTTQINGSFYTAHPF